MVQVIFLGTNGWFDTAAGNTISVLIRSKDYNVILDAGFGIAKLINYINNEDKPAYLFLSHYHLDHVVGLHSLALNTFTGGLTFIVSEEGREILRTLMNSPFTIPPNMLPFNMRFFVVPNDINSLPFPAEILPLKHSDETHGIRVTLDGKIITYCPDTGYCRNAVILARKADLLIAECAFLPGQHSENWPHLNPETAAYLANEADVQKLVLTHFDPVNYPGQRTREHAQNVARKIFPESYSSKDNDSIEL